MEVLITNTAVAEEDGGESLLQLLDSCRLLFPCGVGIACTGPSVYPQPRPWADAHNPHTTTASSSSNPSDVCSLSFGLEHRVSSASAAEDESALYNLKSPFWEEARLALEQTNKNTMRPLLDFLDREEAEGRLDDDKFVSSLFDFPSSSTADEEVGKEKTREWVTIFNALDLDRVFSVQEELQVREEVEEEEEEPLGSPRKKRRVHDQPPAVNDILEEKEEEFGEVQSYEEHVFLTLFDAEF